MLLSFYGTLAHKHTHRKLFTSNIHSHSLWCCKLMVWHWLFFDVLFKMFRLVLEPSSVENINVSMHDSKSSTWKIQRKILHEVWRKHSVRLMHVSKTCRLLGWRCGHFQIVETFIDPLLVCLSWHFVRWMDHVFMCDLGVITFASWRM